MFVLIKLIKIKTKMFESFLLNEPSLHLQVSMLNWVLWKVNWIPIVYATYPIKYPHSTKNWGFSLDWGDCTWITRTIILATAQLNGIECKDDFRVVLMGWQWKSALSCLRCSKKMVPRLQCKTSKDTIDSISWFQLN